MFLQFVGYILAYCTVILVCLAVLVWFIIWHDNKKSLAKDDPERLKVQSLMVSVKWFVREKFGWVGNAVIFLFKKCKAGARNVYDILCQANDFLGNFYQNIFKKIRVIKRQPNKADGDIVVTAQTCKDMTFDLCDIDQILGSSAQEFVYIMKQRFVNGLPWFLAEATATPEVAEIATPKVVWEEPKVLTKETALEETELEGILAEATTPIPEAMKEDPLISEMEAAAAEATMPIPEAVEEIPLISGIEVVAKEPVFISLGDANSRVNKETTLTMEVTNMNISDLLKPISEVAGFLKGAFNGNDDPAIKEKKRNLLYATVDHQTAEIELRTAKTRLEIMALNDRIATATPGLIKNLQKAQDLQIGLMLRGGEMQSTALSNKLSSAKLLTAENFDIVSSVQKNTADDTGSNLPAPDTIATPVAPALVTN